LRFCAFSTDFFGVCDFWRSGDFLGDILVGVLSCGGRRVESSKPLGSVDRSGFDGDGKLLSSSLSAKIETLEKFTWIQHSEN
jgi:hypothetical protein